MKTVFAVLPLVLFVAASSSASPKTPQNLPHAKHPAVQTAHQAKKEMKMSIRPATEKDVDRMVELSDLKRTEYAGYSPVFWHKAADANPLQVKFFHAQLSRDNNIILVAEENGQVKGFIIASIVNAPPVYDPGGSVCMIDDFTVSKPELWPTTGRALLQEATRQAKTRGAVLSVIVCPHLDEVKRSMLKENGSTIASEWYVHPL